MPHTKTVYDSSFKDVPRIDLRCRVCGSLVLQVDVGSRGRFHGKCRRCNQIRTFIYPINNK